VVWAPWRCEAPLSALCVLLLVGLQCATKTLEPSLRAKQSVQSTAARNPAPRPAAPLLAPCGASTTKVLMIVEENHCTHPDASSRCCTRVSGVAVCAQLTADHASVASLNLSRDRRWFDLRDHRTTVVWIIASYRRYDCSIRPL